MPDLFTWFLGANTPGGFRSLYDGFTDPARGRFYLIKGSPGSGKSTFLRALGAHAASLGLDREEILCSGDPESLDGLYIPALRLGYADATSPHVLEPRCPGGGELYLDFSAFLDAEALTARQSELEAARGAYGAAYARAYRLLSALGETDAAAQAPFRTPEITGRVRIRARAAALRLLRAAPPGPVTYRFASAVTCQGRILLWDTIAALADRICTVESALGLCGISLAAVEAEAASRGLRRILCPDPADPSLPAQILFPDLSLAFVALEAGETCPVPPCHRLLPDETVPESLLRSERNRLRALRPIRTGLERQSCAALAEANRLHGRLEALYRPHVDFAAADALTRLHKERISALAHARRT